MALSVVGLCSLPLALLHTVPAYGAELNGFAINTQEASKTVTITLFTDQRVPYATEHQGKQFAIILPNTQISAAQLKNGLPVMVDNQNRFIGRAVPAEDGKVRIVLPNLSVNDYAVSIQQQHSTSASAPGSPVNRIRPLLALNTGNAFEQAMARLPKAQASAALTPKNQSATHTDHPIPTMQSVTALPSSGSMMWNPYTVRVLPPALAKTAASTTETKAMLATEAPLSNAAAHEPYQRFSPAPIAPLPLPGLGKDPLWYLHALPTHAPKASVAQDFKKLAADDAVLQNARVAPATQQTETKPLATSPTIITSQGLAQEVKASIESLPQWLLITLAIFLGGIGVFTLVGGLVLLKVLCSQMLLQLTPAPLNISLAKLTEGEGQISRPESISALETQLAGSVAATTSEKPFATQPESRLKTKLPNRTGFQDVSRVSALDYLKESPSNVTQAVHNAGLVKFPAQKKNRTRVNPVPSRRQSNASYSPRP